MPSVFRTATLTIVLIACSSYSNSNLARSDEWTFKDVERIVAVSDIHGAYDALVKTLQQSDVIDRNLAWSGGKTHLVITGDLLDRGPHSRRAMDLIIRLEHEAPLAGGQVHQLLGNHEVMNLIGDLRYVSDEEYAAFLDIELVEEREIWYQWFRSTKSVDLNEATVRAEFEEQAPPGFFGHRRAFEHDGIYGEWLLEKPLMVVINETVFTHGGLSSYVAQKGLKGVNGSLKKDLYNYMVTREKLGAASVLSPFDRFKQSPAKIIDMFDNGLIKSRELPLAQKLIDLSHSPLHDASGPTWYRGTATCSELIEGDSLNIALRKVGARRAVFGHTPTVTRKVQQRMNGRIVEIDTGMLKSSYDGVGHALIIEGDELSVVNQDGVNGLEPIPHPVRVGHRSMPIDDYALEQILLHGVVSKPDGDQAAWRLLEVTTDEQSVSAYFSELAQDEDFAPELAAYRLDRLLGLGMVPVTVRRKVAGRQGTLQFVPAGTMTERRRVADGVVTTAACFLSKQSAAMYVFDTLIHNPVRTPSSMLYKPDDVLLMLVDHASSFGVKTERPAYLIDIELTMGDQWRTALQILNDEVLRLELGDVLDESRLAALGIRRDALIRESMRH